MNAKLIFLSGTKSGSEFPLDKPTITIGRQADQDIVFHTNEVLVSARHAVITERDGEYFIEDRGSRNGTLVNKKAVQGPHQLEPGDVISFGPGGPSAQFVIKRSEDELIPTLEVPPQGVSGERAQQESSSPRPSLGGLGSKFSNTREFVSVAYQRAGRRARRTIWTVVAISLVTVAAVVIWQEVSKARLESALADVALALESERTSRSSLEQSLGDIQARYDSLSLALSAEREQVSSDVRFGQNITRNFSRGVALIVFSYGFVNRNSDELLRFRVDARGNPITSITGDGRRIPVLAFGGSGPAIINGGSATGFLIDSTGQILTNRHVAEPWDDDGSLETIRATGLDVVPKFTVLRAYFPPGNQVHTLTVTRVNQEADVALMKSLRPVDAPILPLATAERVVQPGERVVFIGYPTGLHNLLFRIAPTERQALLEKAGEDNVRLAEELAKRRLIQPLVTTGSVSDTTALEVIHTAATTGGGSGGPVIDARQKVVAVHYAQLLSPVMGDPFRTQRAVRVKFVWDMLSR